MKNKILPFLVLLFSITSFINAQITSTTTGGNWSDASTWVGGIVPASGDNVVIVDGANVVINQTPVSINNLTVGQGTSGRLGFDGTARTVTITGNLFISTGGSFAVFNFPVTYGNPTIGSAVVTNIPSTAGMIIGTSITGTGLDPLGTIVSIDDLHTITLSLPATASGTNVLLTIKPTGTVTSGTSLITNVTSTTGVSVGNSIGANGLTGATVTSVGATDIGTSVAATISGTLVPLTIRPVVTHSLNLGGDLTNNGTFDMSFGGSVTLCNVTFTKNGDQAVSGSGTTTRFRVLSLSKTTKTNKVISSIDITHSGGSLFIPAGSTGTWEQIAGTFSTSASQTTGATTALNITGSGNWITSGTSNLTIAGDFLVNTTGTVNIGTGGHKLDITTLGATATLTAGTINVYGKVALSAQCSIILNGANINVDPQKDINLTGTEYTFRITTGTGGPGLINWTAGTITILDPNANTVTGALGDFVTTSVLKMAGTAKLVLGNGAATSPTANGGFRFSSTATLMDITLNTGPSVGIVLVSDMNIKSLTYTSCGPITGAFLFKYGASGTLAYNGTAAQITSDIEFPVANAPTNLTINNTSGVSLHAGRTLSGTLTLSAGNLTTTSSNLLTLGTGALVSGGSAASFVNGPMAQTVASTSSTPLTFPIGKGTAYRPAVLTVNQDAVTPTIYKAEMFNTAPPSRTLPGTLGSVSSVRYFNFTKDAGSNLTSASLTLSYSTDDNVTDANSLRIAQGVNTDWIDLGGIGTANTTGTITSTGIMDLGLGDFVLAKISGKLLTITAFLQGYTNAGGTSMSSVNPLTVTVELHHSYFPYDVVESKSSNLNSSGVGTFTFNSAVNGTSYYIGVKSENTVETYSATGQSFSSDALSYDFTSANTQSYGSNMILKGSKWCFYSGDVNQDGIVDGSDLAGVDNDNNAFAYHTFTDLNGDGVIDGSDLALVDNNNNSFIGRVVPAGAPGFFAIKRTK